MGPTYYPSCRGTEWLLALLFSIGFPYPFFAFPIFLAFVFTSQTPKPKDHPSINSSILAHLRHHYVTLPQHHPPSSSLNLSRYTFVL